MQTVITGNGAQAPRPDDMPRTWIATTGETRAKRLLAAIEPTSDRTTRCSLAGLRATIIILGTREVQLPHVGEILRGTGQHHASRQPTPWLLDNEALREDARAAIHIAKAAMTRKHAASGALELPGKCLAVVDALLSMPEGEREAA